MPPRRKSLQTVFVETILFISLFALVGHLFINFWERYVVQDEISKMKNSLYTLKDTINHIGVSYNQLYKELQYLADIAESGSLKHKSKPDKYDPTTHRTDLAQELLQDIQIQAMIDNGIKVKELNKMKTEKTQTAANKDTQIAPNATFDNLGSLVPQKEKRDKNVGNPGYRNKKIQHVHKKNLQRKDNKDIWTATPYPKKSEGAGTDEIEDLQESISSRRPSAVKGHKRTNIHKCHDNDYCTANDNSEYFEYSKF